MSSPNIRVSVRAAIVRDDSILLIEYQEDPHVGWHYCYPGGGVEIGESLQDALRREVREETGAEVEIRRLLHIWELVPERVRRRLHRESIPQQQEISFLFLCTLREGSEPRFPDIPDTYQTDLKWVSLSELSTIPLLPVIIAPLLAALRSSEETHILLEEL